MARITLEIGVLYEVTLWLLCYYTVMFVYRMQLKKLHQIEFEHISKYTDGKMDYIPLSFMHGFYVAFVVDRWKQIFANIGFVDSAAFWISTYVIGDDFESRTHRRNLIRYLCLTQVLVLRDISIPVRRRFPTVNSLVEIGLLQEHEKEMMESVHNGFPRYWMPIHWMFTLGHQLTKCGKLSFGQMEAILNEAKAFREKLQLLLNFDWVPVPLAYSQVVFMATRVYFFLCLFSRQFRIWEQNDSAVYIEYYFPLMTFLQLICYMGWLKVAESLLNPLGDDDDDFESCYIVDRNLSVGMTMVDECYAQLPDQMPDKFGREGEIPPMYGEPGLSDPQHQLVGSAKLAAEENPNVFTDILLLDSRRSSTNPDRKRSLFTRLIQRAVGGRNPNRNHRRASMQCPGSTVHVEGSDGIEKEIPRKSKSIACTPFASSYDHISSLRRKAADRRGSKTTDDVDKMPKSGMEQIKFDQSVDGRKDGVILGKFIPPPPSPRHQKIGFNFDQSNEFKHLETLSEEDDEDSSNGSLNDNSNNRNGSSRSPSTSEAREEKK